MAHPGDSVADLVEQVSPAVVNISTARKVDFMSGIPIEDYKDFYNPNSERRASSLGSGFVIDASGVVVTNHHVIDKADEIEVLFTNGDEFFAEVIGRDKETDLAVLKVRTDKKLPFVMFGDSSKARPGDPTIVIGNPFGLGTSVSTGIVSARNRNIKAGRYDDFIQTDAAINKGNSGGPVFNNDGDVIGVTTAIYSPTGTNTGVGFAVPAALAEKIITDLLEFGHVKRGWIGVNVRAPTPNEQQNAGITRPSGAIIVSMDPRGPAARSDLRVGDLVLKFAGKKLEPQER